MIKMGVYVNDLNLHDSSRELILAGTQQSAELQLALDQVHTPYSQKCQHFLTIHCKISYISKWKYLENAHLSNTIYVIIIKQITMPISRYL